MIIFRTLQPITFNKSGIVKAPHSAIYSIISKTQNYPKFIPWCDSARIIEAISDSHNRTELSITFKKFQSLKYVSEVYLNPAKGDGDYSRVHSICRTRPLKQLNSLWEIKNHATNSSFVNYTLIFEFQSPLFQLASSMVVNYLGEQMWHLFQEESIKESKKCQDIEGKSAYKRTMNQIFIDDSKSLEQFLEKHKQMKAIYSWDENFSKQLRILHQRLKGSQYYDQKMLFEARNWLVHH